MTRPSPQAALAGNDRARRDTGYAKTEMDSGTF